jgi:hypothetical protein
MWFDAADLTGTEVSTWTDKGNNHDASGTTAPVVQAGLNGHPYVELNGISFNVAGNAFINTMVAVFRCHNGCTTWSNHGAFLNRRSGRSCNWLFENGNTNLHGNQYPAKMWMMKESASQSVEVPSTFSMDPISEWMIVTIQVAATNCGETEHYLGRSDHSQTPIDVAEILAYNAELSDTERYQVEQYLAQKWFNHAVTHPSIASLEMWFDAPISLAQR